ncbi:MAG TPA: hypothetical protein VG604_00425 [Candidatus Saccharimonadales bacterium]|nr:hypothetical protein [Candidatus Saccharimonadales bacterium]
MQLKTLDLEIIAWLRRWFLPLARVAIFIVYFYFGILKLFGESPASPLAHALVNQTIGSAHFNLAFNLLAIYECVVGVLFLIPKATRLVIPLLVIHVIIVCSPLVLVPHLAWVGPFVPTLEGQYIIKNVAIIALAIGIAAQTPPLKTKRGKA